MTDQQRWADDRVIRPSDPGLTLLDQLRLKAALLVARHGQWHHAVKAPYPLRCNSVSADALFGWRLRTCLMA